MLSLSWIVEKSPLLRPSDTFKLKTVVSWQRRGGGVHSPPLQLHFSRNYSQLYLGQLLCRTNRLLALLEFQTTLPWLFTFPRFNPKWLLIFENWILVYSFRLLRIFIVNLLGNVCADPLSLLRLLGIKKKKYLTVRESKSFLCIVTKDNGTLFACIVEVEIFSLYEMNNEKYEEKVSLRNY